MTTKTIRLGEQQEALVAETLRRVAAGERLSVFTGAAGTGKSTALAELIARLVARGEEVTVCAPTHKAASRAAECTGRDAYTLHALISKGATEHAACPKCDIELGPAELVCPQCGEPVEFADDLELNARDPGTASVGTVLVIDEASMVGADLAQRMWGALPLTVKVIAVGDPHQLPPVGDAAGFPELQGYPFELTTVYRQAAGSPVLAAATAIREERVPFTYSMCGADYKRGAELCKRAGLRPAWMTLDAAGAMLARLFKRNDGDACAIVGTHLTRTVLNDECRAVLGMPPRREGPQIGERIVALATRGGMRNADTADVTEVEPANFGERFGDGWVIRVQLPDGRRRELAVLRMMWETPRDPRDRGRLPRSIKVQMVDFEEDDTRKYGEQIETLAQERADRHRAKHGTDPSDWLMQLWRAQAAREVGAFALYLSAHLAEVDSGYAITCHKAQGSQYAEIIVVGDVVDFVGAPAPGEPIDPTLVYRWSYTALTRAVKSAAIIFKRGDDWR